MADMEYAYAVARIRGKELTLLTGDFLEQLIGAASSEDCIRLLKEKGWKEETDDEAMLEAEREKTWNLIRELAKDMSPFDVFLYVNDYHNLKAAIKEAYLQSPRPEVFSDQGTIEAEKIRNAVKTRKFGDLPEEMQEPAERAYRVMMQTGNGQLCDIILDRAALEAVGAAGTKSGDDFLKMYGELTVAAADIKMAVRSVRTGRGGTFLEDALAPCETLDKKALIEASEKGTEGICLYLEKTPYSEGAGELRRSISAFERWCDNLMIRRLKPQRYNPFGLSPLAAYILARENEIKSVRIILSGKRHQLSQESIRERVREMYV